MQYIKDTYFKFVEKSLKKKKKQKTLCILPSCSKYSTCDWNHSPAATQWLISPQLKPKSSSELHVIHTTPYSLFCTFSHIRHKWLCLRCSIILCDWWLTTEMIVFAKAVIIKTFTALSFSVLYCCLTNNKHTQYIVVACSAISFAMMISHTLVFIS